MLLAAMLAGVPALEAATIYKWTDGAGVTHFTTDPPPPGIDAKKIEVKSSKRKFGPSGPSARVKRIRCRDFRGALKQLDALDVPEDEKKQWQAAKKTARNGIDKWCP